jgi:hypothetical protein
MQFFLIRAPSFEFLILSAVVKIQNEVLIISTELHFTLFCHDYIVIAPSGSMIVNRDVINGGVIRRFSVDFESKSGVKLNRWNDNRRIGEAVSFIQSGGVDSVVEQLKKLETTAENVHKRIKQALEHLPVSNKQSS